MFEQTKFGVSKLWLSNTGIHFSCALFKSVLFTHLWLNTGWELSPKTLCSFLLKSKKPQACLLTSLTVPWKYRRFTITMEKCYHRCDASYSSKTLKFAFAFLCNHPQPHPRLPQPCPECMFSHDTQQATVANTPLNPPYPSPHHTKKWEINCDQWLSFLHIPYTMCVDNSTDFSLWGALSSHMETAVKQVTHEDCKRNTQKGSGRRKAGTQAIPPEAAFEQALEDFRAGVSSQQRPRATFQSNPSKGSAFENL